MAQPGGALAVLCAAQGLVWTLAPALTHSAPPLDVVEMLVWGREGVVATYKHPNLPGLLLEAVRRLSFGALWPAYLLAQLCVVASFMAVYLLGRDLLGPGRALAGTLLLTGIFYYSWPTPEMNHNLMQMPLWAWACLALWRSVQGGRIVWWLLLGLFAGLSLWAKYSSGLLLAAVGIWILADAGSRAQLARIGPWAALAAFAAVAAPQVQFLIETDFLPFDYALARAESGRIGGPLSFLLTQIADHGVFLSMALAAGLFGKGAARLPTEEARARRFLALMGLLPALLAGLMAAATGMGLKDMWGMPMFNLSGSVAAGAVAGAVRGAKARADRSHGRHAGRAGSRNLCSLGAAPRRAVGQALAGRLAAGRNRVPAAARLRERDRRHAPDRCRAGLGGGAGRAGGAWNAFGFHRCRRAQIALGDGAGHRGTGRACRLADGFGACAGAGGPGRRTGAAAGNLPVERLRDRPPDPDYLDDSSASGSLKTKKRLSR